MECDKRIPHYSKVVKDMITILRSDSDISGRFVPIFLRLS